LTIGAPEIPVAQPIIPEATETSEVAEMTIDDNDAVEEVVEEANDSTTLPNIKSIPVSESTSTFAPPVPEEIFPTSGRVHHHHNWRLNLIKSKKILKSIREKNLTPREKLRFPQN